MFVGTARFDILLSDIRSLKQKRGAIRPVMAELRRTFEVAVAQTGHLDLLRRAEITVAVVAADAAHCQTVLAACERAVANRPELELLSVRTALHTDDDE